MMCVWGGRGGGGKLLVLVCMCTPAAFLYRHARVHSSSSFSGGWQPRTSPHHHQHHHQLARVLNSLPLSTFKSCSVSMYPCPMSTLASSSFSFSPLSRGLEHQTQPPTLVTPIPLPLSPDPLYRPPILPTPVCLSPYTRQLTPVRPCQFTPYPLQCSTS